MLTTPSIHTMVDLIDLKSLTDTAGPRQDYIGNTEIILSFFMLMHRDINPHFCRTFTRVRAFTNPDTPR